MGDASRLLELNADLDRRALADRFSADGRVQVRDVLRPEAAKRLFELLSQRTPWGMTWQAGEDGPHRIPAAQMDRVTPQQAQQVGQKLNSAIRDGEFAFVYSQYAASDALRTGTSHNPDHDQLVRELNGDEMLGLVRAITGETGISWCDAQVAHFGPTQFLSVHEDFDALDGENRKVAYVLNLTPGWLPDWGGYLNFFDQDGDIIHGFCPRFNSLNMFRVPRVHNVGFVTPFSAGTRLSVAGWFRLPAK